MEKGFNDDELADIMSEIESLEQEFSDEPQAEQIESVEAKEQEPEEVQEQPQHEPVQEEVVAKHEEQPVVAQHSEEDEKVDEQMEEVLDELAQMPVEDVIPEHTESHDDNIHHMKQEPVVSEQQNWSHQSHGHPAHTSMSFKVEGEMKLDLNFCIGGQNVALQVSDHGFEIELAGGAKFTLPLGAGHQGKKVA